MSSIAEPKPPPAGSASSFRANTSWSALNTAIVGSSELPTAGLTLTMIRSPGSHGPRSYTSTLEPAIVPLKTALPWAFRLSAVAEAKSLPICSPGGKTLKENGLTQPPMNARSSGRWSRGRAFIRFTTPRDE